MRWMIGKSKKTTEGKTAPVRRSRRRLAAPRWLSLTSRSAAILGIALVGIGGPVWLWHSGWIDRTTATIWRSAMTQSARLGLAVQDVRLQGRHYTRREEVVKAVGVRRGAPILGYDLAKMRMRLEALPWVKAASVERRLPSAIRIRIRERRPMALWQRNGQFVLVDDHGETIADRDLGKFRHLVTIVGKDAPRHAPTLFAMIASEPELARRVTAATRVGQRRWNLRLESGILVELPEHDPHRAWRRLAQLDARHKLLERDVKTIDMRLPDRLIVKPGALGAQARRLKGRNT